MSCLGDCGGHGHGISHACALESGHEGECDFACRRYEERMNAAEERDGQTEAMGRNSGRREESARIRRELLAAIARDTAVSSLPLNDFDRGFNKGLTHVATELLGRICPEGKE
jgi:hypothetical protein